ncbi:MAG: sugar kinase [Spirochaetaceae bacterium]|nr:MAG: sugar kinase [Spirochaetaceae bacterium]
MQIRKKEDCLWDEVSLGEVMIRLDPGENRIRTARSFRVWEGGGEYNVARGLRRAFGLRTAVVTALVENEVGCLLEDLMLQGGVDLRYVKWMPYDGIGRDVRIGLNFTERGFGVRGAVGTSDRARSAASALKKGDVDWNAVFGRDGVRWFHTGGIYAGLSETTPAVLIEAVQAAKEHGTIVSYDLNYRPSLWKALGGPKAAQEVNRQIAPYVDVLIGNEEDFSVGLGFEVDSLSATLTDLDTSSYEKMIARVVETYPNVQAIATTLREVHTATVNDWKALLWTGGTFYHSIEFPELEILDRVGGGDSFASGLIYGFLNDFEPQTALDYGVAHGALAMTTAGDTSTASLKEVQKLVSGGGARVER